MTNKEKILNALNTEIAYLSPVEWGEKNRILSKKDSRFHGPLSFKLTPYLIKIANSFMPNRSAQIISVMKGSQIGFSSAGIYTMLGWIIGESPANTLFITENDTKLKDQMQGPIDQMINSSGLANKVGTHNLREREAKGRRKKATGDTLTGIDFGDGFLYTLSGQTIASLSSWNIKYGIYDEVERWKGNYKSAGDFMGLVEPRHKSYGNDRKLLFGSTPEIKQTSNIEPLYLLGDQQKYHIPCKHCGEMIELVWHKEVNGVSAGVYYERESNGKFIEGSAMYVCQKCGNHFHESHKYDMYEETYLAYKNGSELVCDWIATAKAESHIYESYQIGAQYAPPGFYSWNDMARNWCSIHPIGQPPRVKKLQAFYNQELGLTWEEMGKSVSISQLSRNTFNYEIGTIPTQLCQTHGNGMIVLLTCAVDLNGKLDDARLDWEVRAWCENGSSYSIDHGSIGTFQRSKTVRSGQSERYAQEDAERVKWTYQHGYTNNVWDQFYIDVMERKFPTEDNGFMKVVFHGIDTGHFTRQAYEFTNKYAPRTIGLKGPSDNKYTKFDGNRSLFQQSKEIANLYFPSINRIKDNLSDKIELPWDENSGADQPEGFMNFPYPQGEKYTMKHYFSDFEGEKREIELNSSATAIGSRWVKKHTSSSNHFWDVAVYNEAVKEIVTHLLCKERKVPVSWENYVAMFKK